jgi:hypothetical protein
MVRHVTDLGLEFCQNVLWHLVNAFFSVMFPEGSSFLLHLPKFDKLNLLAIFSQLFFSLLFLVFERWLGLHRPLLLLLPVVIGAVVV